jgi:hypothetical protein
MQSPTGSPPPAPETATAKRALLDAFDNVLKTQADERESRRLAAEARRRSTGSRIVMLMSVVVLAFTGGYLYVERPDWVFPRPPAPESPVVREASLRISIANAAQHIERYRQRNGRLPATLADAGATTPGLVYEPGITSYQLHALLAGTTLSYQSGQSLERFVGNSFAVIVRRRS